MQHITVLEREAVDSLCITPSSVVVDATYGAGGHARRIAAQLGREGALLMIDADASAFTGDLPISAGTLYTTVSNFKHIQSILDRHSLNQVDAVLADLGWRLEQFTEGAKGFSFASDDPLIMTFGDPADYVFTAHDVVNGWSIESLADIIYAYGDERYARRIARAIGEAREHQSIDSSLQLANIVAAAVPKRVRSRLHPATQTFQALRIVVNDELAALEQFLQSVVGYVRPGGHISIITFHSIEDRVVKRIFKSWEEDEIALRTPKKPSSPTYEEIRANPRARSAKLRTITKL